MRALEPSPLPWRFRADGYLLDKDGCIISRMTEADARLIIATIESHAVLLAAAKLGARRLRNITYDERFWGDIEEAISKTEGKVE